MTYEELVDDVLARNASVQATKMMGMPSLKGNGKLFAGFVPDEDATVFKLGGDDHARALALEGAHLFEPMAGRQMKEWVVVPKAHSKEWPKLADAALRYASG
jgi:hypothetical protein